MTEQEIAEKLKGKTFWKNTVTYNGKSVMKDRTVHFAIDTVTKKDGSIVIGGTQESETESLPWVTAENIAHSDVILDLHPEWGTLTRVRMWTV